MRSSVVSVLSLGVLAVACGAADAGVGDEDVSVGDDALITTCTVRQGSDLGLSAVGVLQSFPVKGRWNLGAPADPLMQGRKSSGCIEDRPAPGQPNYDRYASAKTCFECAASPHQSDYHGGNDIFGPRGEPLVAAFDGVAVVGEDPNVGGQVVYLVTANIASSDPKDAGTPGWAAWYAHLDDWGGELADVGAYYRKTFQCSAKDGAAYGCRKSTRHPFNSTKDPKLTKAVKAGDVLGFMGNTGSARNTTVHLHFELLRVDKRRNRLRVDPYRCFQEDGLLQACPAP
jgi:hypothetical protein